MRTGIFGGTFDPFHLGHQQVCKQAILKAELERLIILPSGAPPHKLGERIASPAQRLEIIRLSIEGLQKTQISNYEIESGRINYTIQSLKFFKEQYPADQLFFIIGDDSYGQFKTWSRYDEILQICTVLVFPREGLIVLPPFVPIEMDIMPISSTEIRGKLSHGLPTSGLLDERARKYIVDNKIYSDS